MDISVCIVLVNYNNPADTIECINSILANQHPSYQIIVIDNSDSDDSINQLRGAHYRFPSITSENSVVIDGLIVLSEDALSSSPQLLQRLIFVKAKRNNGFAAANNVAIRFILESKKHHFVWLLNNDTVIEPHALKALVERSRNQDKRIGITGSKLCLYFDRQRLQGVGGSYNKWFGKVSEIGFMEPDQGQWDSAKFPFDYVIGAAMFLPTSFLADVGLMNEEYFLYFEELDWALRAKEKHWLLDFCPQSVVFHKMGRSINQSTVKGNSIIADFYSVRNRVLVTKRYFPLALFTLYPSFLLFIWNRIKLKQYDRILLMFRILLNPRRKHNDKE